MAGGASPSSSTLQDGPPEAVLSAMPDLRQHPSDASKLIELIIGRDPPELVLEWACLMLCGSKAPTASTQCGTGICGMVWKTGDTVYHCRTCGMDPSCAICHECFINSDHTGHDYWMFSSGGGCCDCGDVEAWKREGFCSRHPGPPSTSLHVHACDDMPPGERGCSEAVLDALTSAYLHVNLLLSPDADVHAAWRGIDPRIELVRWLTTVAATSIRMRSLVGVHLTKPRGATKQTPNAPADPPAVPGSEWTGGAPRGLGAESAIGDAFQRYYVGLTPFLRLAPSLRSPVLPDAVTAAFEAVLGETYLRAVKLPEDGGEGAADAVEGTVIGGAAGESILDVLLRIEGKLGLPLREELHSLYFELMRDMPFKRSLLCHVIKHYPSFISHSTAVALSPSALHPRDSGSTTFGKFTVQFKGNLVATMVTEGLLGMLLATLQGLLLQALEPPTEGGSGVAGGEAHDDDDEERRADEDVPSADGAADEAWARMLDAAMSNANAQANAAAPTLAAHADSRASQDHPVPMELDEGDGMAAAARLAPAAGSQLGRDGAARPHATVVSAKSPIISTHLYSQLCYDIRYTLNHAPLADELLRRAELLPLLLQSIALTHGIHPLRRRTHVHIVREEHSWADAFSLSTEMSQLHPHIIAGIAAPEVPDETTASILAEAAAAAAASSSSTPGAASDAESRPPPSPRECVVSRYHAAVAHASQLLYAWLQTSSAEELGREGCRGRFSYHITLHRLLASLVSYGASSVGIPLHRLLPSALPDGVALDIDFVASLAKHPLRLQVLVSQTRGGWWVRNGHQALKPAALYRSASFGEVFMLPDLLLLQYCLLRLSMPRFLCICFSTFALRTFFPRMISALPSLPARDHSDTTPSSSHSAADCAPLAEDMLALLVMLITERSLCAAAPDGQTPERMASDEPPPLEKSGVMLERQLLHRLALSEHQTYSELTNALPKRLVELPDFEEALARVANFVAPQGMSQGRYVLRREAWPEFDAYFPLYTLPELHRAQERANRFLPSDAPPPQPPDACAAFSGLPSMAACGALHAVIYAVCYAAAHRAPQATPCSERLLCVALRLLQLALAAPNLALDPAASHAASAHVASASAASTADSSSAAASEDDIFGQSVVGCTLRIHGHTPRGAFVDGEYVMPSWHRAIVLAYEPATRKHILYYDDQSQSNCNLATMLQHGYQWYFDGGGTSLSDARVMLAPVLRVYLPSRTSIVANVLQSPMLLAPATGTSQAGDASTPPYAHSPDPSSPQAPEATAPASPPPTATASKSPTPPTLLQLICDLSRGDRLPSAKPLATHALKLLRGISGEAAAAVAAALAPASSSASGAGSDRRDALRRKRLAKERQAAIMQRFCKAQAAFEEGEGGGSCSGSERPSGERCSNLSEQDDHMDTDGAAPSHSMDAAATPAPFAQSDPAAATSPTPPNAAEAQARDERERLDRERMPPPPAPSSASPSVAAHSSPNLQASPASSPSSKGRLAPAPQRRCALCHDVLVPEESACGILAFAQRPNALRTPPSDASILHMATNASPTDAACTPCTDDENPADAAGAAAAAAAAHDAEDEGEADRPAGAAGNAGGGGEAREVEAGQETELFVRMDDLQGAAAESLMARVFAIMQQQQEQDSLKKPLPRLPAAGDPSACVSALSSVLGGAWSEQGVHVRACGHEVHALCVERSMSALRPDSASLDEGEFTCPVCRRLSNTIVPITPWQTAAVLPATPPHRRSGPSPARPLSAGDPALMAAEVHAQPAAPPQDVFEWLHGSAWTFEGETPPVSLPPFSLPAAAVRQSDNASPAGHSSSSVEALSATLGVSDFVANLQRILRHDSGRPPHPSRPPSVLVPRSESEHVPGLDAVLLCGSTAVSCAVTVSTLQSSGRSVLGAISNGLTQAEGLRHLAAAATASATSAKLLTSSSDASAVQMLRSHLIGLLRAQATPRGRLHAASADASSSATSLPLLALDPSALLVCISLLWPRSRWLVDEGEWYRLLYLIYAVAAAQLVALAPGTQQGGSSSSCGVGLGGGVGSVSSAGGHTGSNSSEWVSQMRAAIAPLQVDGRFSHGLGHGSSPSQAPSGSRGDSGSGSSEVEWEGLLPFLRVALLFSHCCLSPISTERLTSALNFQAANESSELQAVLLALGLPHPTSLGQALGAMQHSELLNALVACLDMAMAAFPPVRAVPSAQAASTLTPPGSPASMSQLPPHTVTSPNSPGASPVDPPAKWLAASVLGRRGDSSALARAFGVRRVSHGAADGKSPFVSLPHHYSELYNDVVRQRCTVCGTRPLQPACCLLCGQLVCAASDCCRLGGDEECSRHAQARHGGAAAFLVVRRTEVLLVLGRRHCWWGSLYLDQHGEEDRGLRRGRPLTLAPHRLKELIALWHANGLREYLYSNPPHFPHLLLLRQRQPPNPA